MDNQFRIVRHFSKLIQNGRTLESTHNHMMGEAGVELKDEIDKAARGEEPDPLLRDALPDAY